MSHSATMRKLIRLALLAAAACLTLGLGAAESTNLAEPTSQTSPLLKQALDLFPAADANHDGVLTQTEANEYRQRFFQNQALPKIVTPAPTFENVAYGPHSRNVLDFWKAPSATNTPLMVCLHSGGFVSGDKLMYRGDSRVTNLLAHGISVAAVNYRYITSALFPAPMLDAARAVQFLRSKAPQWEIDPHRIAASGTSAGGNLAVWLACHGDLADASSTDPVARRSSRISFAVGSQAQTFNDFELLNRYIYQGSLSDAGFFRRYAGVSIPSGLTNFASLLSGIQKQIAFESSAINFVSKDDPPLYLSYGIQHRLQDAPYPAGTPFNTYIHSPKFGQLLKAKYDELGLECVFHYRDNPPKPGEETRFIFQHFGINTE